ncbi:claudin-34 [Pristis pectinata]|uniref:claudin-34 n=1 Tax=Pristis pectinata TaxID=685728 RepID=UPI00223CAD6C|nr:claudin-34 [Pristis pectinata]
MGQQASGAPWQLVGFVLGAVGWIGASIAMGLIQWRVWHVNPAEIDSGVAWVGIWRACFYGNRLASPPLRRMFCQAMGSGETFVPREIAAAQVLMVAAVLTGAVGKAAAASGLKGVYVGGGQVRLALGAGGCFHLLASICTAIPAGWNLSSVAGNRTIAFPPHFHLPQSPWAQEAGAAIYVALFSSGLLLLAALLLFSYRNPPLLPSGKVHPSSLDLSDGTSLISGASIALGSSLRADSFSQYSWSSCGVDNQAFRSEDY